MDIILTGDRAPARLLPRLRSIAQAVVSLPKRRRLSAEEQFAQAIADELAATSEADQETTADTWAVLDDAADQDAKPEAVEPSDPVAIAARLMVEQALADPGQRALAFGASSLVVVEVPHKSWTLPISTAWHDASGRAEKPLRPDEGDRLPRCLRERRHPVVFMREDKSSRTADRGNDDFGTAVSAGVPVIGFSTAPDRTLPSDLIASADLRLAIPGPNADIIAALAEQMFGATLAAPLPSARWPLASALSLRMAGRHATSADEYVGALASLLSRHGTSRVAQTLDDLPGMGEATDWAKSVLRDVTEIRAGRIGWSAMDRGAVLVGPPGTGKTSLVRALAADAGMTLVATSYAAWQSAGEGYLGDVMRTMRACFDEARKSAPAILFIDELDTLGSRGSGSTIGRGGKRDDWWRAVINGLLEAMDGALALEGVLVIGATNDISGIDPALLRSGRLERRIHVPLPDAAALQAIFRVHLAEDLVDADLASLAAAALGGCGADVERWVRGARRIARHAARPMALADLRKEVLGGSPSQRDAAYERVIAIHEAGHCVAGAVLRPGSVTRATMSANGNAEASTAVLQSDNRPVTETWLAEGLVIRLAGRAAEHELLGEPTGGSGGSSDSDLAFATWLAVSAENALGFGDGLTWRGLPSADNMATSLAMRPRLEARVTARLDDAYQQARRLMRDHQGSVGAVAAALQERRALTGGEIEALVRGETLS